MINNQPCVPCHMFQSSSSFFVLYYAVSQMLFQNSSCLALRHQYCIKRAPALENISDLIAASIFKLLSHVSFSQLSCTSNVPASVLGGREFSCSLANPSLTCLLSFSFSVVSSRHIHLARHLNIYLCREVNSYQTLFQRRTDTASPSLSCSQSPYLSTNILRVTYSVF